MSKRHLPARWITRSQLPLRFIGFIASFNKERRCLLKFSQVLCLLAVQLICVCFAQTLPQILVNGQAVPDNATAYGSPVSVTMSGYTGGHIFYTTNGSPPTVSS